MVELNKQQHIFSIKTNNEEIGSIESNEKGNLITSGFIGEGEFNSLIELIIHLQGHGISIDDFYY